MSRVAKTPIAISGAVRVSVEKSLVCIESAGVELSLLLNPLVGVNFSDGVLSVFPVGDSVAANAQAGTARALLANMVTGVVKGFEKRLQLVGVGYKANVQGNSINLSLGFSHPVLYNLPVGLKAEAPTPTEIVLRGPDKQVVGQAAAEIRAFRPPEPYKGKGVRYANEYVAIKETKKK